MSLIELLVAVTVLVVGFMGLMLLMVSAIASNNRNKLDSQGWMLATSVIEQLQNDFARTGPTWGTTALVDCVGNSVTVNTTTAAAPGAGCTLSGTNIDYSEASPPNQYHMDYVVGGGGTGLCEGNQPATYDVRWNITQVTAKTSLITVGVKLKRTTSANYGGKYFALPVTLRTYAGGNE